MNIGWAEYTYAHNFTDNYTFFGALICNRYILMRIYLYVELNIDARTYM